MVYTNIFNITPDNENIQVSIETSKGSYITSLKLWSHKNFKDNTYDDLSFKLKKTSNKEVFLINILDINVDNFNGIYFLEIESDDTNSECNTCSNTVIVATANLTNLDNFILNEIIELNNNCLDDNINDNNIINQIINKKLLLESIYTALSYGYYNNAIDIYNSLVKLATPIDCVTCMISDPINFTGLGYGILNNNLILQ